MSKQYEYYRYFDEYDYDRIVWEREQLVNEEWEQLNKHKNYGYVTTQKSNQIESENPLRA